MILIYVHYKATTFFIRVATKYNKILAFIFIGFSLYQLVTVTICSGLLCRVLFVIKKQSVLTLTENIDLVIFHLALLKKCFNPYYQLIKLCAALIFLDIHSFQLAPTYQPS